MNYKIKFFRGDDHKVAFTFTKYNGPIDKMYFTVKDEARKVMLQKTLDNGITKDGDSYIVTFKPSDTDKMDFWLKMIYDIEIIVNGSKHTIAKDEFILEEDITTPAEEVE